VLLWSAPELAEEGLDPQTHTAIWQDPSHTACKLRNQDKPGSMCHMSLVDSASALASALAGSSSVLVDSASALSDSASAMDRRLDPQEPALGEA